VRRPRMTLHLTSTWLSKYDKEMKVNTHFEDTESLDTLRSVHTQCEKSDERNEVHPHHHDDRALSIRKRMHDA
jgi:hypothetical protein